MLKATFRSFLSHKGRMILSAIAVLLSVAFVAGTLIFTDTITKTFDDLFRSTSADVSVNPKSDFSDQQNTATGETPTLDNTGNTLVAKVGAVDGVKNAHSDISVQGITIVDHNNKSVGPSNGAPTIGTNWYVTPKTPLKITSGHEPQGPNQMMLDSDTANKKHVKIGDTLRIIAGPRDFSAQVVGIATFTTTNPGAALGIFDTPTAATELLGNPNLITSVSVEAAPGQSDDVLKQRIISTLGPGYDVKTAKETADKASSQIGTFLNFIKYAMLGFAGVALLVGVFLIFNTFSMLVAQRTRELGLMRAIGASRRDVNRSVMVEALLLGVIGSTLGFGAGFLLAAGLKSLIGKAGVDLKGTSLVLVWSTPVIAYAVGVIVTLVAAYIPARRAGRVSPMAALRDAGAPPPKSLKGRTIVGGIMLAIGVASLVAGGTASKGSTGGAYLGLGVITTLVAFVVLGPVLARLVIPVLGAPFTKMFGTVGRLSRENTLRNPRRTGATAAALMIGVALVAGMSVVASSLTDSVNQQIDKALGADFTVVAQNGFGPEVVAAAKSTPGVGLVVREQASNVKIAAGGLPADKDQLLAVDPGVDTAFKTDYVSGSNEAVATSDKISVAENWAKDHHVGMGDKVTLTWPDGSTSEHEIGAIRKQQNGIQFGNGNAPIIGTATLAKHVKDPVNEVMFVNAAPGHDKVAFGDALKTSLNPYPQLKVQDQADFKGQVQSSINTLLYLIYGLLALAIIIAILGVVNTLALSVVERTREIGLMRAIGMSRRQIRRMVRVESTMIAVFGAVLGLALGLAWGVTAMKVLATQGLHVLTIPWSTVISVVIAAAVVGLLAALLPALRASRLNVLNAIASE